MSKTVAFKDRGVYVGFETNGLTGMRVRTAKRDDTTFEALIHNWAGEASASQVVGMRTGDLIMSFLDVLDWTTLSERDKALHASIVQYGYKTEGYIDPQSMREIRFETDMAFADPMLRMRAVEQLRIESADAQNTYFEILSIFARKYGATVDNRELKYVSRPILQQLSRENPEDVLRLTREITKAASAYGQITADVLAARLDFYSAFAAPICSLLDSKGNDRDVGYLSRQLGALEDLLASLEDFYEETHSETGGFITAILENANKFIEYAKAQANMIQMLIMDDRSYTIDETFQELKNELFENRMHIAFALDGWEQHFIGWKKISNEPNQVKEEFITKLYKLMPQPTKEVELGIIRTYDMSGAGSRTGAVKMMHSWDSETRDEELFTRVEASKDKKTAVPVKNTGKSTRIKGGWFDED